MARDPNRPNWHSKGLVYFDERRIELHQEIKNHPILLEYMQKHPQDEFEMLISEVAAYCEVILKGDYYQEDIDELCGILTTKLIEKRTGVLLMRTVLKEDKSKQ